MFFSSVEAEAICITLMQMFLAVPAEVIREQKKAFRWIKISRMTLPLVQAALVLPAEPQAHLVTVHPAVKLVAMMVKLGKVETAVLAVAAAAQLEPLLLAVPMVVMVAIAFRPEVKGKVRRRENLEIHPASFMQAAVADIMKTGILLLVEMVVAQLVDPAHPRTLEVARAVITDSS